MTELAQAAANVDWLQVVLNGGPPCFHVEDGRFCLRAEGWARHPGTHRYVSLFEILSLPEIPCCPPHEEMYRKGTTQPLDNCFVCIRNERDELKERLEKIEAALRALVNHIGKRPYCDKQLDAAWAALEV